MSNDRRDTWMGFTVGAARRRWILYVQAALATVTLALGPALQAAHAQCEASPAELLIEEIATPGLSWSVAVEHCYAYVADDFVGGVQVVDVCAQPPVVVASVATVGSPLDVEISGRLLFVASGFGGVEIFDIGDPLAPVALGIADTPGFARSVTVAGRFAYVADGLTFFVLPKVLAGGVQLVDVSNPTAPVIIGEGTAPDPPEGEDPFPSRTGGLNPGDAQGVAVAGDFLYVADGPEGLTIFQITHELPPEGQFPTFRPQLGTLLTDPDPDIFPTEPATGEPTGVFPLPGLARDVAVAGTFAYVADGAAGLKIIDIANPLAPVLVQTVPTNTDPNVDGDARRISLIGGNAYVVDPAVGLVVIDITDPPNAVVTDTVATMNLPLGIATSGDRGYVADLDLGLQVVRTFDMNPATAEIAGAVDTLGNAVAIDIAGNFAYVADGPPPDGGLKIFDVSDPTLPVLVGGAVLPERAADVVVDPPFAYVVDWQPLDSFGGLHVFDVSDPTLPMHVQFLPTRGDSMGVDIDGEFAYLAGGFLGFSLDDISRPGRGFEIRDITEAPDFTTDLTVSNNVAYVGNGFIGLRTIDISFPLFPIELARLDTPGFASRVAVHGKLAAIADGAEGVAVVDIADPANPVLLASIPVDDFASDVTIAGTLMFVADGLAGVKIFDVQNPALPVLLTTVDTPGEANGVRVDGDVVYVADGSAGLQIIRLCGEPQPTIDWRTVPTTVPSGDPFLVEWELRDFLGPIAENQAFVDRGGPLEEASTVQLDTNGVHGFTFTAPVVTVDTDVQVVARALDDGMEVLSPTRMVTITAPPPPPGPKITWVTPPPSTIVGGLSFTVTWNLADFGPTITENQAFLDRGGPLEATSPVKPGTNGNQTHTFNTPSVITTTTVDVVARALDDGMEILSPALPVTITAGPVPVITWVTPPPATTVGGTAMPVTWNLTNFGDAITENQAHFGIRSVLGSSPVKPGTNGNHSHTFIAPNVGTFDGTKEIKYIVRAFNAGTALFSPLETSLVSAGANPPTVTWVIPPPATAGSGSQFIVSWELTNYQDPVFVNAAAWGITSLLGQTADQAGGDGVYSAIVTVPTVTNPGTLLYTAFAMNEIEFAFAPLTPVDITLP